VRPRVQLRVGEHLAELVARDVRERGESLAVAEAGWGLRVAPGVAVEVEEEAELDLRAVDRARAVPRAVTCATAGLVRVDRVVRARHRLAARRLRHLGEHLARRRRARG